MSAFLDAICDNITSVVENFRQRPAELAKFLAELCKVRIDIESGSEHEPHLAIDELLDHYPQTRLFAPIGVSKTVKGNPDNHKSVAEITEQLQLIGNTLKQISQPPADNVAFAELKLSDLKATQDTEKQ